MQNILCFRVAAQQFDPIVDQAVQRPIANQRIVGYMPDMESGTGPAITPR